MNLYCSIRVTDNGKFNNRILQLCKKPGDDNIFIKYPDKNFLPVSAVLIDNLVYISAAMVGSLGDIKITTKEWLRVLKGLCCKEKFDYWNELINNKKYQNA